jgi:aminoglycoside phosphotransferase (APT) family kinase protein
VPTEHRSDFTCEQLSSSRSPRATTSTSPVTADDQLVEISPSGDGRWVIEYLRERGLLGEHDDVTVRTLSGGVSSDVAAVLGSGIRLVVKRPLRRLRVSEEWLADKRRALIEARALQTAGHIAPLHVPPVFDVDEQTYTIVIGHAEPGAREWRTDLLAGRIDTGVAAQLGEMLADWHTATGSGTAAAMAFSDRSTFEELRVEPFYRRVGQVHPDMAERIDAVLTRMLDSQSCLVHGDFSPKNVLLGPATTWVIDWEVAHYGDPYFDLALLMTHLACKALHYRVGAAQFDCAARDFLASYLDTAPQLRAGFDEPYLVNQIACLLLARVDGPSPAAYLNELPRRRGRAIARAALGAEILSVNELWRALL